MPAIRGSVPSTLLFTLLAVVGAGCSQHGVMPTINSASVARPEPATSVLAAHPVTTSTASPSPAGQAQFTLTVPLPAGDAVSPGTKSIGVSLATVDGSKPKPPVSTVFETTPRAKGCSVSRPVVCSLSLTAPVGTDTFSLTLYSSKSAAGSILGLATVVAKIAKDHTTVIPLVPNGVPVAVTLAPANLAPLADGQTHKLALAVSAQDASGATIIGPGSYSEPITLAIENDNAGDLQLSTTSIDSPSTGTTNVAVTYDGNSTLLDGQIVATAKHATGATATITPLSITPLAIPGLFGGGVSESQTITVSEYGVSAAYSITQSGSALSLTCLPASCAPPQAGGVVRVTISVKASGAGSITIKDPNGNGVTLPYSATLLSLLSKIVSGGNAVDALANGPDGNVWALLDYGSLTRIGSGNALTTYPLQNWFGDNAPQLVAGPDDALWYVDGLTSAISRFGLSTSDFATQTQYQTSDGGVATAMAVGPDKALWMTEQSGTIGRITTSGAVSGYINPSGIGGTAIVAGGDGAMWILDNQTLYRVDMTGDVTSFSTLTDTSNQPYSPALIAAAGTTLWLTSSSGEVCAVSTGSGSAVACGQTTLQGGVASIAVATNGTVWVTGLDENGEVAAVQVGSNATQLAEFAVPQTGQPSSNGIVSVGTTGLWFGMETGGLDQLTLPAAAAVKRHNR